MEDYKMATSKEASEALGSNHSGKTRPVEALKSDYLDRGKPDPKEKDNLAEYHTRGMLQEEFENAMEMRRKE